MAGTFAGGAIGSRGGVGGALAGETIGSGVGTTTGELFRLAIGRMIGANDMSTLEMFSQALGEGALASAVTVSVGGTMIGAKELYRFLNGFDFSKSAAIKAGLDSNVNVLLGK